MARDIMRRIPLNSEKSLLRACLWLLQSYENNGLVRRFDRLNSGAMAIGRGRGRRFIKMCRRGTPDIYAIRHDGTMLWLELKREDGQQTEDQADFEKMLSGLPGHVYRIIRDVEEIKQLL